MKQVVKMRGLSQGGCIVRNRKSPYLCVICGSDDFEIEPFVGKATCCKCQHVANYVAGEPYGVLSPDVVIAHPDGTVESGEPCRLIVHSAPAILWEKIRKEIPDILMTDVPSFPYAINRIFDSKAAFSMKSELEESGAEVILCRLNENGLPKVAANAQAKMDDMIKKRIEKARQMGHLRDEGPGIRAISGDDK